MSERVVLRWHHIRHPHPGGPERNQRLSVELDGRPVFSYPPQPYLSRQVALIVASLVGQENVSELNVWNGNNERNRIRLKAYGTILRARRDHDLPR